MRRVPGLLSVAASALLLGGCGGGEQAPSPPVAAAKPAAGATPATVAAASLNSAPAPVAHVPAASDVAASRALLDAYLSAWNRGDPAAIAGFLADDAQVFDALLARKYDGRAEARREVVEMYLRAVPDGQWALRGEPLVSADGFSYEWTLTGTNSGNWTHYLRGRSQRIDFKGVSIVRLRDGRIAYQANYFDTNALGAQAGW